MKVFDYEPLSHVSIRWLRVSMVQSRHFIFTWLLLAFCFGLYVKPSDGQSILKRNSPRLSEAPELYRKGLALVRQGRLDEGLLSLKKGLDSDPHNLLIMDAIGATLSLQGHSFEAERYFSKAIAIDPTFTSARKNLAITCFSAGQYNEAALQFQKLWAGSDTRPVASLFLGILAERKHQYARSVAFLKDSGNLIEQYPEGVLSLATSLFELHRAQPAKDALIKLDNIPSTSSSEWAKAGALYSELGDDGRALSAFDRAEQSAGRVAGIEYKRAEVLARLGQSAEALHVLASIAQNNPSAAALNHLAHVAEDSHQYDLAIQSLRLAAKLDPKNEDNYLQFSTICSDAGKYPEALQAVDLGLQSNPNSYRLLVQKAAVLDNTARREEAEQILRKAARLSRDNSEALLSLGIVQTNANKFEAAAETLRLAIRKYPNNFYMRYWLGYALVQLDEAGFANPTIEVEAEQAFRVAVRLRPTFADSYYQLSRLYMHKDQKLAEQSLTGCLRADPNYGPAQYALAQLYLKTGRREEGYKLFAQFKKEHSAAKDDPQDEGAPTIQR